jgi:tetratricopeptide (TPR) repeat protein
MLAHHYLTALELDRAAGVETADLSNRARLQLRAAGDRAYALNAHPAATGFYRAALDLWRADEPGRSDLLFRYARSIHAREPTKAVDVVTEAREALLVDSDRAQAAEAEILLAESAWLVGQQERGMERVRGARQLIAGEAASYSKAYVISNVSRFATLAGEEDDGIRFGREALAMAEEPRIDAIRAHALNNIGKSRVGTGDPGGIDDLEQSVAIAVSANSVESVRSYGNLASTLTHLGELEQAWAMLAEAVRLAERFGVEDWLLWVRSERCWQLYFQGEWDEALELSDRYIAEQAEIEFWMETPLRWLRGRIRLARGDVAGGQEDAERALSRAEEAKDPQVMFPSLAFGARALVVTDPRRAERLASEFLTLSRRQSHALGQHNEAPFDLAVTLAALGQGDDLLKLIQLNAGPATPWRRAAAAYVSHELPEAADIYASIGALPNEAYARLRAAEAFVDEGRRAEADEQLESALAFWRSVRATAYVLEGEALLAKAG